ncbi:hypothetical protein [Qipengyuania mesophila]|uniref:hypothetical protein n=1 Tax=Qipengyuania mesophila TaxID=2867246 RepID=UPI0035161B03
MARIFRIPFSVPEKLRKALVRRRLLVSQRVAMTVYWLSARRRRHAGKIELIVWALAVVISLVVWRPLQAWLGALLDPVGAAALRGLISTVGAAMIGATAIAASFILFALQVNVERLPHGLFRHFSSDRKLIASVAASLLLAIAGTTLSLVADAGHLATIVLVGILALLLILRLLYFAYRRSLQLIDPTQQLQLIYSRMARDLQRTSSRLDTMSTLVELEENPPARRIESKFDTRRAIVLQANPNWTVDVKTTVGQAAAYARRAGENGDLEVSAVALSMIVNLNAAYVQTKGRTFFSNQLLIDNPLVTDGVFNEALENLRRLSAVALTRRDELQLEQIFNTMDALVNVFCRIGYANDHDSKSHALLAAGYLESAVEAVLPSGLTDTVMRGLQAIGRSSNHFVQASASQEATSLIKKIAAIGCFGAIKPDQKPIALVAMEELRDLTLSILRSEDHDSGFALRQLREAVSSVARTFLQMPDAIFGGHATYLAPYYSVTTQTSLCSTLTQLGNALAEREAGDALASRVIDHLEIWADGLFHSQKDLLLLSVEKRSPFFFDIAHWIAHVSEVLLFVASVPAAREHARGELRKHAHWLASTLSWIPVDVETAKFVEGWSHRDNMTDLALQCRRLGEAETYQAVERIMFNWALEAGKHHTGWDTLSQWLLAVAGLALTSGDDNDATMLKGRLTTKLALADAPNQEMRDRAARCLREAANEVRQREFEIDRVRQLLSSGENAATRLLLTEMANILSPGTKDEPVRLVV